MRRLCQKEGYTFNDTVMESTIRVEEYLHTRYVPAAQAEPVEAKTETVEVKVEPEPKKAVEKQPKGKRTVKSLGAPEVISDEARNAWESKWDLYFTTGSKRTINRKLKEITDLGILWLALQALPEDDFRRPVVEKGYRKLFKAQQATVAAAV